MRIRICCKDLPGENSPAFIGSSIRPVKRLGIIQQQEYSVEEEHVQAITDSKVKIKLISVNEENKSAINVGSAGDKRGWEEKGSWYIETEG